MANTVAWGLLKGDRWCMIVVCHWLKPAWQNMASLLSVVGSGIPHSMPQGGKSYHLIFKKPPLVSPAPPPARRLRRTPPAWRPPEEYSLRQTVRSWAFWNLTGGTALRLLAKTGATVHLLPILASKGVSEQTAAFLLGGELFLTVPLYLVLGWAADRFPKPSVLMWASLAGTAAFALLAVPWHGIGV